MTRVLWITPDKPENISIGRRRIQDGLRERGYDVTARMDRRKHARTQFNGGFDVLISTTAAGGIFGPPAKIQGAGFIMDHVDPIRQMYTTASKRKAMLADSLQRVAFRTADGILYVYDEEQERVSKNGAQVRQTTLGVDYDRFANTPTEESIEHTNGILNERGVDPGFAVYIGGLEPIYQVPEMLESAKRHGWPLVVAGCGHYENRVEHYAGMCENIHNLGVIDHEHVPALLHQAGVGVCLVDDPHTVKVLEYAAAGLPIVHVTGRAESVLPDEGVFYTEAKPVGVAGAVSAAMDNSIDYNPLRDHAAKHDYQRVIDDYEDMIQRVL